MKGWKQRTIAVILSAVMILGMVGCGGSTAKQPENTTPTGTEIQKVTDVPKATDTPNATDEPVPTETPATDVPTPTPAATATPIPVAEVEGTGLPFRNLTADEIVAEMGTGWNLGNTMDGHTGFTPSETSWQSVITTKGLIETVHNAGFNTVRIPITWGTMIDDSNNYTINEQWISRVQEIVDYCVSQDMYAIINIHHDGAEQNGWLHIAAEDPQPVYDKFQAVWKQIAERFRDYDEHLIFEDMNEVTGGDDTPDGILRDMQVIMKLNQIFVDTVRATGSNNAQRWLSVPARYTNITNTCKDEYGFTMPEDEAGRLFLSVHYYDWQFGLQDNMGVTAWTLDKSKAVQNEFDLLKKFTSQGYPVILGEYGCVDKNNTAERAYHVEVVNRICQMSGVVPCLWDIGWYDRTKTPDYSFSMFDRTTYEYLYKDITDAIMRGMFTTSNAGIMSIEKPETVTSITDFTLSDEKMTITIGEDAVITTTAEPTTNNDVILWKTADSSIATVYNGHIQARGIGTTTITAYTQSGSAEHTINVTVIAQSSENPVTKIKTASAVMQVNVGKSASLEAEMTPDNTDAFLTYQSTNPDVVTVNEMGRITGTGIGTAYVVITASTGLTKSVKVKVSAVSSSGDLDVALNVYYNDNVNEYYGNDYGAPVTITGPGQYTVVFDAATDLSAAAQTAGVTSISGAGAIYIKDHAVTLLEATKTAAQSCKIRYDKVVVDGVELTITNTAEKEAVKASGVLDTGDPLNAWDGSAVAEVEAGTDFVLKFTSVENPKRIEVTFTVLDLVFEATTSDEAIAVDTLKAISDAAATLTVGESVELKVQVNPGDTTEKIAFISTDASIVTLDCSAVNPVDGVVTVQITALKAGTATITAMGEGSAKAKIEVTVQ